MVIISGKPPELPELTESEKQEMDEIAFQMIEEAGGVKKLFERMEAFKRTTSKLSDDYASLLECYNKKWVAYYDCRLQAHADSHEELMEKTDALGIPRSGLATRYVTNEPQRHIIIVD